MGLIVKNYTFSAGATIIASEHNSNFDTIYNEFNGNITNTNINATAAIAYSKLNLATSIVNADISASAAIVDTKLAQITTASKVSGAAITALDSVPSGAGVLPITNIATGTPTGGKFVRDDGTLQVPSGNSNVVFSWIGVDGGTANAGDPTNGAYGIFSGTATIAEFALTCNTSNSTGTTVKLGSPWKFVKIAGISTLTVYARVKSNQNSKLRIDINSGGLTSDKTLTNSGAYVSETAFTLDVSSLTNGTAYIGQFYGLDSVSTQSIIKVSSLIVTGS